MVERWGRWLLPVLELAILSAVEPAGAFPHFRGIDGSGSAAESGLDLVEDFRRARLVWCSEARNPLPEEHVVLWAHQIYPPWRMAIDNNGGYSSPVVADGRVHVAYWRPAGSVRHPGQKRGRDSDTALIDGDDVLVCMDLRDGRTLWETVFAAQGANLVATGCRDGQMTPCIAGDRVLFLGSIGRAYCVDARTGRKLWANTCTMRAKMWEAYKADMLAGRVTPGRDSPPKEYADLVDPGERHEELGGSGGRNFNATPCVVGDVAVFGINHDCVGLDLASGRLRWQHRGVLTSSTSPVRWQRPGGDRIVAYGGGHLSCIDPVSGELLWKHGPVGGSYQGHTPAIADDLLICTGNDGTGKRSNLFIGAYRLHDAGAELAWRFPDGSRLTYRSPVIHRGRAWFIDQAYPMVFPPGCGIRLGDSRDKFLYCVDLADGRVLGVEPCRSGCASLSAADDRIFFDSGTDCCYFLAEPTPAGRLRRVPVPDMHGADSVTPVCAGGVLLRRGAGNLVSCWDLRAAQPAPPAGAIHSADLAQASFVLDLSGALPDRRDLRLHLVARDGVFRQAWATLDDHLVPEILVADTLRLGVDGALQGSVDGWIDGRIVDVHGRRRTLGRRCRFALDLRCADGVVTGSYRELPVVQEHFAEVRGRFETLRLADEHFIDPSEGTVSGRYADRVADLSLAGHDPAHAASMAAARTLGAADLATVVRAVQEGASPVLRRVALDALARQAAPGRAFATVQEALARCAREDPELSVRLHALRYMTFNQVQFPSLLALLDDAEPLIRQGALVSIAEILLQQRGNADAVLALRVRALVDDPELRVRAGALVALGAMGAVAVPQLLPCFAEDRDRDTVEELCHALRAATAGAPVLALEWRAPVLGAVQCALSVADLDDFARSDAMAVLLRTGEHALPTLEALCAAASPRHTRLEALVKLGEAGARAHDSLPVLIAASSDADPAIRRQALLSIGEVCADDQAPVPALPAAAIRELVAMVAAASPFADDRLIHRGDRVLALLATGPAREQLLAIAAEAPEPEAAVARRALAPPDTRASAP